MGLFSQSFDKPGKGVDPNEPEKRSFFRFMDILSRKFWNFGKINLIYSIALIPTFLIVFFLSGIVSNSFLADETFQQALNSIVSSGRNEAEIQHQQAQIYVLIDLFIRFIVSYLFTVMWGMGPVTAGITYIMRNYSREEHAWIFTDFKDATKSNFKQATVVFLVDILAFILFYTAFRVYSVLGGFLGALKYVIFVISIIYTMMHFYIYPMMVTFKLSIKDIYKNALVFALGKLPSNVLVLTILFLIHFGLAYAAVVFFGSYIIFALFALLLLEICILLSISSFLVNFNAYPKMKKHMNLDANRIIYNSETILDDSFDDKRN